MPTLDWLTRKDDIKVSGQVPYRILGPVEKGVYGEPGNGNLLIQGDNLDALKSLLPFYAGSVKCIFIDPPYNTRKDFAHYQDNLEHSQWLEMMYPRLELLRGLLAEDGSIWAIIDDDEGHYLKVIMDEIFGRRNFITNVVWQKKHTRANDARWFSDNHDHIIVHAKDKDIWKINRLPREEKHDKIFSNPDNDPRGRWASGPCHVKTPNEKDIYPITTPMGKRIMPPPGTSWRFSQKKFQELVAGDRIYFGKTGNNIPRYKRFLTEIKKEIVPITFWTHAEVGHNQDAKQEVKSFNANDVFATPKPEKLLMRILQLATHPGDLVLDSFLGSATTAAVAHKMNRQWIGIEMGEHTYTHCIPRLQKVIAGEQGGISKAVNWQGGGGFCFLRLGEVIFLPDGSINSQITFADLAAHLWFAETRMPFDGSSESPFLGVHDNTGYALLYNGILQDKRVNGGNVLTKATLADIRRNAPDRFNGPMVVYANGCRFDEAHRRAENLEFKQLPYDCEQR